MSIQQFCLRWNNHQPNFISVFTTLLNNESLVDVTLAAEGKHIQAHKVVLSACSVYFQTLFTANPSRHPIVILKDVKYSDLRVMVDFMYCGEVNVSQEQLPQILETARMLKIKGLTEMPESNTFTKSQAAPVERTDLLTPGESSWGSDAQRHSLSPCNLSPSMKRKRIRKVSAGSTELNTDEKINYSDGQQQTSLNLVKSDSITLSSLPSNNFTPKIKVKEQLQSQYHKEENGSAEIIQQNNDVGNCMMRSVEQPMEDLTNSNMMQHGVQWNMLDHGAGYVRYSVNQCQTAHQSSQASSDDNIHAQDGEGLPFTVPLSHPHLSLNACDYQQQHTQTTEMDIRSPGPSSLNNTNSQTTELSNAIAPLKRRRTSNPQSEENFQRALEAVRFGGIGFCKAARMFGVNNRTLWLEYKKKGYPNNRPSIKNRIKREPNVSPPPEAVREEPSPAMPQEQQVTLLCPPHPATMMGFIDSHQMDFGTVQNINRPRFADDSINLHSSPINLHGMNFNAIQ